jgi:hypothetical protein
MMPGNRLVPRDRKIGANSCGALLLRQMRRDLLGETST